MTGTRAMETSAFGIEATRDDRLHRGRNVVGSFLMQGEPLIVRRLHVEIPLTPIHSSYRLGTGLQPGHPSHLHPHLLGRSGDWPIQRQGDPGDLPCSVRFRRPHSLLAPLPPYLQDPRRRHARRRCQASPEHVRLRRALVPPPHVALLGSPFRDCRRLVRQRRLVSRLPRFRVRGSCH